MRRIWTVVLVVLMPFVASGSDSGNPVMDFFNELFWRICEFISESGGIWN